MPVALNEQTGEAVYLTSDGQWAPAQMAVNPQTKERMAFDGKEWKPLQAPSKGVLGYVDDAARSLASGVTFGYADEIAAKMDELIGRGNYAQNVERERARDKQIPAAIAIPGEIAGGVAGAVAAAPVAGSAAAVTGLSRLPQTARYILSGGAGGALFGSGQAEEGGRLIGALQGAMIGGPAGYVAPKLMAGAQRLWSGVRNAVSPQANVAADLGRAIERDGATPAALSGRLTQLQQAVPEATLADVGGENVRGVLERVAQTPGSGRTVVVPRLEQRQQAQMNRLGADLQALTGSHRTATQAVEQTMAERASAANPLYTEAMDFNAREIPDIMRVWQNATETGWGRSILGSADLRKTLQSEYGIRDAADAPMMVLIDAWKKQVDGVVGEAIRAGNSNKARVLEGMRDRVIGTVDQFNPAYLSARNAWAGPSQYLEAVEQGRNILSRNVSAEELAATMRGMSDAQREAYTIGAVSAIRAKMGSDAARLPDMTKYLRSPEMRDKIALLLPDDAARQRWAQRLDTEIGVSQMTGRALGNSATYRRGAERQDADSLVGDLIADAFKTSTGSSTFFEAVMNTSRNTARRARDTLRSRSDNILGDVLTDPAGNWQGALNAAARQPGPLNPSTNQAAIGGFNALLQ